MLQLGQDLKLVFLAVFVGDADEIVAVLLLHGVPPYHLFDGSILPRMAGKIKRKLLTRFRLRRAGTSICPENAPAPPVFRRKPQKIGKNAQNTKKTAWDSKFVFKIIDRCVIIIQIERYIMAQCAVYLQQS